MWLLSRKLPVGALGLLLGSAEIQAADFYFVPQVEIRAEHHSDFDLRPSVLQLDSNIEGYFADFVGTAGWRNQRGLTEIRPRITLQKYPDRDDLQRSNQYLDWSSLYHSLRSDFQVVARYSREDRYRAEVPAAAYDEFDPEDPTVNESGRIALFSEIQTRAQIRPEYLYHLSQQVGVGLSGFFQTVRFDSDAASQRVDYDDWEATGFLQWALGQRTDLSTGLYTSKYEADDNVNTTKANGLSLDLEHRWTETFRGTAGLTAEHTEVEEPGVPTDKSNNWGLTLGTVRRGPVSQLRFQIGRTFAPTTGARAEIDEVRLQYTRGLTQRLQFTGAVRGLRRVAQGDDVNNNRRYARGELGLRWNVTPTWYMGGNYSYIWQEYEQEASGSNDQVFMLSVGYRGLPPQR